MLEERAIEIKAHYKITETEERRQQVKALLQTLQQNENDCFHYFLYIIEKNEFNYICDVLASQSVLEAVRKGIYDDLGILTKSSSVNYFQIINRYK